jgi:hypothetical protein
VVALLSVCSYLFFVKNKNTHNDIIETNV